MYRKHGVRSTSLGSSAGLAAGRDGGSSSVLRDDSAAGICLCSCHSSLPPPPHRSVPIEDCVEEKYDSDESPASPEDPLFRPRSAHPRHPRWCDAMSTASRGNPILLGSLTCLAIIFLLWRTSDSSCARQVLLPTR